MGCCVWPRCSACCCSIRSATCTRAPTGRPGACAAADAGHGNRHVPDDRARLRVADADGRERRVLLRGNFRPAVQVHAPYRAHCSPGASTACCSSAAGASAGADDRRYDSRSRFLPFWCLPTSATSLSREIITRSLTHERFPRFTKIAYNSSASSFRPAKFFNKNRCSMQTWLLVAPGCPRCFPF